jgi:hypothetical protein
MFRSPIIERILILILIIAVFASVRQCRSVSQEKEMLSRDLKITNDSIHYFKLKNGTLVAEKESYQLSIKDYKKLVVNSRQSQKDLKKRIGNLNRLNSDLKIQLTTKDDIQLPVTDTVVIVKHDTIKAGSLHFHDRFLTLNGLYLDDSLKLSYQFRTGLDIATYWKDNGLFKPRSLFVNVVPDNPHVTIYGLDNYLITEQKKFYQDNKFWFGLGFLAAFIIPRH